MEADSVPTPQQIAVRKHLENALAESADPETRYHIRQALQMIA
ncbi:hypothetical protein [Salinigranum sp. GCM10025319]